LQALYNVVQALANIQGEIVNLAQCLKPPSKPSQPSSQTAQSSTTSTSVNVPNAHPQSPPPVTNAVSSGLRSGLMHMATATTHQATTHQATTVTRGGKRGSGSAPGEDESKV
jgi:hypothetical protein